MNQTLEHITSDLRRASQNIVMQCQMLELLNTIVHIMWDLEGTLIQGVLKYRLLDLEELLVTIVLESTLNGCKWKWLYISSSSIPHSVDEETGQEWPNDLLKVNVISDRHGTKI